MLFLAIVNGSVSARYTSLQLAIDSLSFSHQLVVGSKFHAHLLLSHFVSQFSIKSAVVVLSG